MTPFYPLLMLPHVAAATISTITPRPYGYGHPPGRKLGRADPFEEFRYSEPGMVEINGDRYQMGSYISKGSFGSVYMAAHVETGDLVAIKVISNAIAESDTLEHAQDEIGFLTDLVLVESENVVIILDSEEKPSSVAIVMELCTTSLLDWMAENVPENGLVRERVISEFVSFFSNAIKQMRDEKIAHFDLAARNILLCGDVWKVTDFDRAKQIEKDDDYALVLDLANVGVSLQILLMGDQKSPFDPVKTRNDLLKFGGPLLGEFIFKLLTSKIRTLPEFNDQVNKILQPEKQGHSSEVRNIRLP